METENRNPYNEQYGVQQPVKAKSGKGWIVGIVVALAIMVVCIVSVVSCSAAIGTIANPFSSLASSSPTVSINSPSVAVIDIDGTIQYDGTSCSPEGLKDMLDRAAENNNIKAVVLRVNSGGGVATAGEEMTEYVKNFEKPIVVSSAATNASAAYEISSQADYIFVDKTTAIGSIGVIMQVTDLSGLYDKLGINIDNITSANSKDAGGGSRPLTEEERNWYQSMVDQINDLFIQTVADGRNMDEDEVRSLATGLLFTGVDAVENGLADEIGLFEDAISKASELAGFDHELPTVSLESDTSDLMELLDMLGASEKSNDSAVALRAIADRLEVNGALG
ncbi:signal peptide peptidase SppA [Adlercreutzia sp. ZJ154]|uniref:signal peptide peptidase SppA n=1 Tax=Adlercreutzia sp. ZJ154 TaxID=2709790 RepID=UPI0013EA9AE0|nr:signal peptide peptidase SppA [Adlercreutzia sp. ZJ154]